MPAREVNTRWDRLSYRLVITVFPFLYGRPGRTLVFFSTAGVLLFLGILGWRRVRPGSAKPR